MKKTNKLLMMSLISCSFLIGGVACDNTSPNDSGQSEVNSQTTSNDEDQYDLKTAKQLESIAKDAPSEGTAESYYMKGVISSIKDNKKNNFMLKDDTGTIFVYKLNDGNKLDQPLQVGETLIIYGPLKWWQNAPEYYHPTIIKREGVKEKEPLKDEDCTPMTIADARNAKSDSKVKLTGVVKRFTYTQQMEVNGFYLIDETGSIHVHSSKVSATLKEGNKITILALRSNYKGENEASADKIGYQGAIEVIDPVVVTNDNKTDNAYSTGWISETSVKDIIETPLTQNITTNIYKVKTFIHKVKGDNATNYLIKDIDDATGSYVYTSNQTKDFTWLDAYNDKLVEMYLSPINLKVTSSSYVYRLQPIDVISTLDNYTMSDDEKIEYIYKYHINDTILDMYRSDPSLQLVTSFNEELWNITNASINYVSNNTDVAKIVDGKLQLIADGKANISITIQLNEASKTFVKEVNYKEINVSDAITVKQAIDAAGNSKVKVKGIVSGSATNRPALYISDETGTIAIKPASAEVFKDIHIGDEVYFEGIRNQLGNGVTQSYIDEAQLLLNNYGDNQYSTASFINSTVGELKALTGDSDHTTQVYKIKAKVSIYDAGRYQTLQICDPNDVNTYLSLYGSGPAQYKWLTDFASNLQSVDLEIILCNWNGNGLKGCVLSASHDGTTVHNEFNFITK